jgi:cytochrome c oxidase assembly protein subunit 15
MAVTEYPIRIAAEVQAPAVHPAGILALRGYFLLLFAFGLGVFVLGVENRITSGGLFNVPPAVDWIPPLSAQDWWVAFTLHQQDPVFSACGGTESLAEFKTLYWWEWWRRASVLAVAATAALGLYGALLWRRYQSILQRMVSLGLAALAYWSVRTLVDFAVAHVEALSTYNIGQYRHAVDVTFASAIVAGVLASAIAPPVPTSRKRSIGGRGWEWLWLGFIVVDIGFGALFAARDAAAAWPTWPGYQGRAFPPFDQLVSYAPVWLNFTFNQYTIQLVHRTLSAGLWSAALWQLIAPVRRAYPMKLGIVRFGLITAQMVTGISTLVLGVPAVLSVVHQVGSICLLVFSFVVLTEVNAVAPGTARLLKSA